MKLYISGPITGYPEHNKPSFYAAAEGLTKAGFDVCNPVTLGTSDEGWLWYMRRDIIEMMSCDAVATLDEWWLSRGATVEINLAASLDLPIRPVADWCRMGNLLPLERGLG